MTSDKLQMTNGKRCLALVICSFFICSFVLRLVPIGRYVTPDEPAWVYRSIRFADALAARDWAALPSTGHPGVTTMWLGTLGITVRRFLNPAESAVHLDWIRRLAWLSPENGEAFRHLAFFLPWSRATVALATTLGLIALYPLLARIFDQRVSLISVGLLAFDPFLIGHSGLLHTDALLATFSLLALVAALNGLREPHRAIWWAVSGLFTGLAVLTKTPALILPPFILSLLAIRHPPFAIRHSSFFILFTIITCFALYPALYTGLLEVVQTMSGFAGRHVEGALRPIFFLGQMTYDPGPLFYPIVLIFRVSPVVLIGLVIGLVRLRHLPAARRFAFLALLAFAILFSAAMSLGAKKHDRYLLPALPPLTLAAAVGWEYLGRRVNEYRERQTLSTPPSFTHLLIPLIQFVLLLPFIAYPLTYANPLAGGPWIAVRALPMDWGEGMGAAARWLNQITDANHLTVAALSVPSFASLFAGHTVPLDQTSLADYIILGPNQSTSSPAHTVTLGFLDHATVLANTAPFEQTNYLAAHARPEHLILLDADAPLLRHYTGPGTIISVADLPDQATIAAHLAELSSGRSHLWLVSDPAVSPITAAHLRQVIGAIATPAATTTVASATITSYVIRHTQYPISNIQHTASATFGDHLTLIDTILPDTPVNTPFPIFLRWQVSAPTPTDLHASLYLRDPDGHLWAEVGHPVLNDVTFPTSAWPPGEWADNVLTLKAPERILPGDYAIELIVADSKGAQLGAWDANDQFQGVRVPLGDVEIAPPARPVGITPCPDEHSLTAGPFIACVSGLSPQSIPSGDTLTLSLTWSAAVPPQADYRAHWQLLDTAGYVVLEQIADLSPYATSRWRANDSFDVRYDMWLDPALPAAVYTLALNLLTPDGRPLWTENEHLITIEILPRDRLFELPSGITHPLDLSLGDTVHLRGFDLAYPAPPVYGDVVPGDILNFTLYWQADGPTDLPYTIFVHLVGPDGQIYGQMDHPPASGTDPTTSWAPGQVIVDRVALPIAADAPAGDYHIVAGMYDAASGGRLPVTNDSSQSLPDNQAILPVAITVTGGQP
ncbi:MAG: glycosyltransferase family 39 protein [Chloroflexota bacterium]|nr:glycosyltransferase family 39 protein [Chloroflexota bacterium]